MVVAAAAAVIVVAAAVIVIVVVHTHCGRPTVAIDRPTGGR